MRWCWFLLLCLVLTPDLGAGEIRGEKRDFIRANSLTVVYQPGRSGVAQKDARSLGFRTSHLDIESRTFRCLWSFPNSTLMERVKTLATKKSVQLITPNPKKE